MILSHKALITLTRGFHIGFLKRKVLTWQVYFGAILICLLASFVAIPQIEEYTYASLLVFSLGFLTIAFSAIKGRIWLSAARSINKDEIGISKSVIRAQRIRNTLLVALWIALYFAVLFANEYKHYL